MALPKGRTNNPNGRPPKGRALTAILETALNAKDDGVARKRLMADLITQAVTTGKVNFPDGRTIEVSFTDWTQLVRWIYTHVDGPPKQVIDLTTRQAQPFTADELAQASAELEEWREQR